MDRTSIDNLPGFRRRFRITPAPGVVGSEVEDDFHCMSVTVRHRDGITTSVEPALSRAPWTTCPGAVERLKQTFSGVPLAMYAERGEKRDNCTHLHDLATLAAAHAFDGEQTVYDILASDPVGGGALPRFVAMVERCWAGRSRMDGSSIRPSSPA